MVPRSDASDFPMAHQAVLHKDKIRALLIITACVATSTPNETSIDRLGLSRNDEMAAQSASMAIVAVELYTQSTASALDDRALAAEAGAHTTRTTVQRTLLLIMTIFLVDFLLLTHIEVSLRAALFFFCFSVVFFTFYRTRLRRAPNPLSCIRYTGGAAYLYEYILYTPEDKINCTGYPAPQARGVTGQSRKSGAWVGGNRQSLRHSGDNLQDKVHSFSIQPQAGSPNLGSPSTGRCGMMVGNLRPGAKT